MSKVIRILFTSVGRRVELVRAFQEASACTQIPIRVYGADMDETAPALLYCDEQRQVCAIANDEYIPTLLGICERDHIDVLVPTIDTDLMKLAEARQCFEALGTKVLIADADKVALCRDKRLTGAFFESCGLHAPRTYDHWASYPGPYPCFVKPKDGSSSIDAYRVETSEQLAYYATRIKNCVVQPYVSGREYTIDAFCDYDGNAISIVPRERLAVRSGEVLKTRIDLDARMIAEANAIAEHFRPRGPITIQLIRDDATQEDWFIEINPRYGGGARLSMRSGARTAEWLIAWLAASDTNVPNQRFDMTDGAVYSRFDDSVCVTVPMESQSFRGVVFDLDDTLYPERDYVRSGFDAVAKLLKDSSVSEELWSHFTAGRPAIDAYVSEHGCEGLKESMLCAYREHKPCLALGDDVASAPMGLRNQGLKLGIITDGRPEGQRAKLDALGLWELVDDVIITDELGGPQFRKPCDIAFRIMQRRWGIPFERMAYVGDNPAKDFQGPQRLGMGCVWLHNRDGLYAASESAREPFANVQSVAEHLLKAY